MTLNILHSQPSLQPVLSAVAIHPEGENSVVGGIFGTDDFGFLILASGEIIVKVNTDGPVYGLAWNPMGTILAVYTTDKENTVEFIRLWSLSEQNFVGVLSDISINAETFDRTPLWNEDGSKIAINKGGEILVWDVNKAETVETIQVGLLPEDFLLGMTWLDLQSLGVLTSQNQFHTYSLESKTFQTITRIEGELLISLKMSPDKNSMALLENETGSLIILNTSDLSVKQRINRRDISIYAPFDIEWASSTVVSVLNFEGNVEFWDVGTGLLINLVKDIPVGHTRAFALTPNGDSLVVVGNEEFTYIESTPEFQYIPQNPVSTNPAYKMIVQGAVVWVDLK